MYTGILIVLTVPVAGCVSLARHVWGVMFGGVACTMRAVSVCVMGCSNRVGPVEVRRGLACVSNGRWSAHR